MKKLRFVIAVVLSAVLASTFGSTGYARQAPQPRVQSTQMLKLTVVLSRVNGEKKIANLPFVLLVTPKEGPTTVTMSSQVGFPTTTINEGKTVTGYQYQNIGTSMNAQATDLDGGLFSISLSINDQQMLNDGAVKEAPGRRQDFSSSTKLLLRDGGTIQYNAATDKATGDVVKVDVTLNVIK